MDSFLFSVAGAMVSIATPSLFVGTLFRDSYYGLSRLANSSFGSPDLMNRKQLVIGFVLEHTSSDSTISTVMHRFSSEHRS